MQERFDFDEVVERRGSGSFKWDLPDMKGVLPMWVADMDFRSPPVVLQAIRDYLDHGVFGYSMASDRLAETIQGELLQRYDYGIDPSHIVWLPGLETALSMAADAVGQQGDGVLCFSPIYPPFYTGPRKMGRKVQQLPFELREGRWEVPWEAFEEELSSGKHASLLFCNPHNPIGKVFERWELEKIAELCLRYGVVICSDEVHGDLILNEKPHIPLATLSAEVAQNTITLMAPSKTYNIAGLSCGFAMVANERLRQSLRLSMRSVTPMVNTLGYVACEAAYAKAEPWRLALVDYLRGNAEYLKEFVESKMQGVSMVFPEATYLGWLNCESLPVENAHQLFKGFRVALSAGGPFGDARYVRLNFGCPRSTLQEGLSRMAQAIASL